MTNHKAAIIDLDGVITRTAIQHAKAWKQMFDAYNEKRKAARNQPYKPFSIEEDYPQNLDGMPRYDGVEKFLQSRGIELPKGNPSDEAGKETVCGLGNWKNRFFHQILEQEGVEIFDQNVAVIRQWKKEGKKLAVISSSKNCKKILEAAGLTELFKVRIDGIISAERGLKGKPGPDIFLEAAKELGVSPDETLIVEDSLAGVEAGKKGGFALTIGIGKEKRQMTKKGADKVVENLREVSPDDPPMRKFDDLPSAVQQMKIIARLFQEWQVILCLDYDGTLTPIVEDYNKAVITGEMRSQVQSIAEKIPVAVVSGRGLQFIKKHVALEEVYYAGSHGFEIVSPGDFKYEMPEAEKLLPQLEEIAGKFREEFGQMKGIAIERKKYAIAVHYRNAADDISTVVKQKVDTLLKNYKGLAKGKGKKVVEVRPAIDWDKGKAVGHIQAQINSDGREGAIIYVGDDITDEDAFAAISNGAGILVGDHGSPTAANFRLENVQEVQQFLKKLNEIIDDG